MRKVYEVWVAAGPVLQQKTREYTVELDLAEKIMLETELATNPDLSHYQLDESELLSLAEVQAAIREDFQ